MSFSLIERLDNSKVNFDNLLVQLNENVNKFEGDVFEGFIELARTRDEISNWQDLIRARNHSLDFLKDLEREVDENELIQLRGSKIHFKDARLLGTQAHISLAWAVADSITAGVGRIICTASSSRDSSNPVKLSSHFLLRDIINKSIPGYLTKSIQQTFGWSIGISYAIRNHFVHDGGFMKELNFFEGESASSGFRIRDTSWKNIEDKVKTFYKVSYDFTRGEIWPKAPCDDLRKVLTVCSGEIDNALGILVGSATDALISHIAYMIEEK